MCACSSNAQLTRSLSRAPVAEAPRRLSVKQKQEGVEQQSKKGGKNTAGGRRTSALHTKMGSTPPAIPWQQPNILFPPPTATGGGGGGRQHVTKPHYFCIRTRTCGPLSSSKPPPAPLLRALCDSLPFKAVKV